MHGAIVGRLPRGPQYAAWRAAPNQNPSIAEGALMIFLSDKRRWFVAALLLGSSAAWAEQEAFFPVFGYNPAAAGVVNFDQVAVGATDPQAITVTYAEAGKGSTTRDLGIV